MTMKNTLRKTFALLMAVLLVACSCAVAAAEEDIGLEIGDCVEFGRYPQTSSGTDETPIEWQVLDVKRGRALLISKYILDAASYNDELVETTWENCALRSRLNGEFYDTAFNAEEKTNVLQTTVTAMDNVACDTEAGNDTIDNVFLLSIQESRRYIDTDELRIARPTDYAVERGVYVFEEACYWWLRSPGDENNDAACVRCDGSVYYVGYDVTFYDFGMRPTIWVRLSAVANSEAAQQDEMNLADDRIGEYITLGRYPQTSSGTDETPIEWLILDVEDNQALLISKYALDVQFYNTEQKNTSWEECTLRSWLNNEFYNTAFNAREKAIIVQATVRAEDNPTYDTDSGNDTVDNVFLLSLREAEWYFDDSSARICQPTDYAMSRDAIVLPNGGCHWWLRTPGDAAHSAIAVNSNGTIDHFGGFVSSLYHCIRPVIRIQLS